MSEQSSPIVLRIDNSLFMILERLERTEKKLDLLLGLIQFNNKVVNDILEPPATLQTSIVPVVSHHSDLLGEWKTRNGTKLCVDLTNVFDWDSSGNHKVTRDLDLQERKRGEETW